MKPTIRAPVIVSFHFQTNNSTKAEKLKKASVQTFMELNENLCEQESRWA